VGFSGKLPAVIYVDVSSYDYRSVKRKKRKIESWRKVMGTNYIGQGFKKKEKPHNK